MALDLSKYKTATSTASTTLDLNQYKLPSAAPPPQAGLFNRIKQGVQQSFQERSSAAAAAKSNVEAGKQTKNEGVLQVAGQAAGLIGDAAFTTAKETVRSVAPSAIPVVKKTIGAAMQTKPAQAVAEGYDQLQEKYPRATANVEAVANIGSLIPQAKVAQVGTKLAGKGVLEGTELAAKGAKKAGAAAKSAPSRAASILTNVPKEDFAFAADPKFAPLVEKAMAHVAENEKQPYFELANRASMGINKVDESVAQQLQEAKLAFKSADPKAVFDVRPYKTELAGQLQTFKEYGLELAGEKNFKLKKTPQSPFSSRELDALNGLLGKINASGEIDIDNLLALSKSLNAAYDEIPLGVNGTPRPYHAAVMAIKAPTDHFIDNILPPNLRSAFDQYRIVQEMKSEIGNKLIDGEGNLKDTAEQFLANLSNTNKGNTRLNAEQIRALTGIDINNEVRAVKVAQKFSNVFPSTGSRTQDVMRSILATGLGTVTMGPVGMAAGIAATSPKLLGKAAIKIGKSRAEGGATKRMGDYLKEVQPGLSTKDVSGMTQEKLDALKDYLIQELDKPGKTLNLDIEKEAANFIDFLKDTRSITAPDVNRAMEMLRLQGKATTIDKLRAELGATTKQPRNKIGQWIAKK